MIPINAPARISQVALIFVLIKRAALIKKIIMLCQPRSVAIPSLMVTDAIRAMDAALTPSKKIDNTLFCLNFSNHGKTIATKRNEGKKIPMVAQSLLGNQQ